MFFIFSKIVGFFLDLGTVWGILLILATLLSLFQRTRKLSFKIFMAQAIVILLVTVLPVGEWLEHHLEMRFPTQTDVSSDIVGVITLAGSIDIETYKESGLTEFESSSDRILEMIRMSKMYPNLPIIYTGGDGALMSSGVSEADIVAAWMVQAELAKPNIKFETSSRNTFENAVFSRALVKQQWPTLLNGKWLLITSARHMPRAVGTFHKAGWNIEPWPVDYETANGILLTSLNVSRSISSMSRALKEWVGLTAYYWTDRTSEWFPAPE